MLVATLPIPGHLFPALSFASKLRDRGYQVVFAIEEAKAGEVERRCFQCVRTDDTFSYSPVEITMRELLLSCCGTLRKTIDNVFADWPISQLDELESCVHDIQPDLIVSDCIYLAPLAVARRHGIKSAVLGVTPLACSSPNTAPFGSGLRPTYSPHGQATYRLFAGVVRVCLRHPIRRVIKKWDSLGNRYAATQRALRSGWLFDWPLTLSDVYLQCSTPRLEHLRDNMSKKVHFIGPSMPVDCDPFLDSSREVSDAQKTVFITWGTMQAGVPSVFMGVMEALLKWGNVNVVAAVGRSDHCRYVPRGVSIVHGIDNFYAQLAGSDVLVTNGGFGGVKGALYFGVPVVCFGTQDDKREVCRRVAAARAGSSLAGKLGGVGVRDVLAEVRRVLDDGQFSSSACAVAEELRQYERSDRAVRHIDALLSA